MWWCSGGMYNVQCRPSFKEAVCVCCCVYYCRVSGLYPLHPLPEEYIHGVLVFILKIRTKLFQKSFFVKMTQSYNWLRVIVIFSYFLKSLAWLVFAFLTYVRCSEEHTEEEECVGGNCELLSPLSSLQPSAVSLAWLPPWIIAPPPQLAVLEKLNIFQYWEGTQWTHCTLPALPWFARGNLGGECFVAFQLAGRKVFNQLWSRISVLSQSVHSDN